MIIHKNLRRTGAILAALAMMACRRWDLTRGKGEFLRFVRDINLDEMASLFWAERRTQQRIAPWFRERDNALPAVIASASPEAVLAPMVKEYGVPYLIATRIEPQTGVLLSPNCKSTEKVSRLNEQLPGFRIRAMYTDDRRADAPLLNLAQQKYVVRRCVVRRVW